MSFEDWVSLTNIGSVESGVFMGVRFKDKLRLIAPCSVIVKMKLQARRFEYMLMQSSDSKHMVIAEIHALPTSL